METMDSSGQMCFPGPTRPSDLMNDEYDRVLQERFDDDEEHYLAKQKVLQLHPPSFLNPFSTQTNGLLVSYLAIGFSQYFLITPVTYYLIHTLLVSSMQYNIFYTLVIFPWALKFFPGLLSDLVPIFNYRRKSWMLAGWSTFLVFSIFMYYVKAPSYFLITLAMFVMTFAYIISDVCTDTMIVERQHYEADKFRGTLQTSGFTFRGFGMIMGSVCGALLYNDSEWGWGVEINQLFLLNGLVAAYVFFPYVPLIELTSDVKTNYLDSKELFHTLWKTMQLYAIIVPTSFVLFYNSFQLSNASWNNFLILGLGFTNFEIGLITIASSAMTWMGMVIYRKFYFFSSLQDLYVYTTFLSTFFSFLQILLILRINVYMGIPDIVFAVGDTAITTLVLTVQYLPINVLLTMVLPQGNEGVTYALLNSIINTGSIVAYSLGSAFSGCFNVSNEAIAGGDYGGVLSLQIFTSCLHVVPLALVWMLPDNREEQRKLRDFGGSSKWGAIALLSTFGVLLIATILYNIFA